MKGCKLCEMLEYQHVQQQQQSQKLLLKSGSLSSSTKQLPTNGSRLLNFCSHSASTRRSSTGSSGSACESNGSPSMSSASSSSSIISVPSPTTSLPSPVAASTTGAPPTTGSTLLLGAAATPASIGGSAGGSSLAAKLETTYHALLPQHFRDMFYASHLLRGYYQPAGPLISQHVLPPPPGNNSSLIVSTKQISSPLDPERDHQHAQLSHQSTSSSENPDNDILITGGDLSTFRYPSQLSQQGPPPPSQTLSTLAASQPPPPPQQGSPYTRQIHPMHYPPYPPSYYSPYPGDAMCYPPPYQHYFPAKVYQAAPTYRRYSSYYQPGPPPPPSDLYDPPPPPSNAGQPPPPQPGSQLVPAGPGGPPHIEHYTGPPGYYTSFNPGGGECYPPRGMQPPYMEYPAPCPCPMQSCPKNVLTGPLIGSNSSNSASNNNLSSTSANGSNSTCSASSNSTNSITSNGNITSQNTNSLNSLNQQLKISKGPVRMHNNHMIGQHDQIIAAPGSNLPSSQSVVGKPVHHHHLQCKRELFETLKSEIKSDVISETKAAPETRKTGQYEETVVPPTPPSMYTVNDKLTEPGATPSPARGSTGPQTGPDKSEDAASQAKGIESNGQTRIPPVATVYETSNAHLVPTIGRKARIGKSMAREMMYGAHALNPLHQHLQSLNDPSQSRKHQHQPLTSHNAAPEASIVPVSQHPETPIEPDINRIKKEEIKVEEEDDVVILEDEVKQVKSEPEIVEVLDKLSDVENERDANGDGTSPRASSKRMKILDSKSLCRKSTLNGYKSLIKQTEPKSYLCLSAAQREKRSLFRKYSKGIVRNGIRKRRLVLTEQQKKRLSIRKRNLIMMEKQRQQKRKEKMACEAAIKASTLRREETGNSQDNFEDRLDSMAQDSSSDCRNDSRGYFSEPDIRTTASRKSKKTRSNEARSKSETKKAKTNRHAAPKVPTSDVITNGSSTSSELMPKLPEIMVDTNTANISQSGTADTESRSSKKSKNLKKKPKMHSTPTDVEEHESNGQTLPVMNFYPQLNTLATPPVTTMEVEERVSADATFSDESHNNNSIVDDANCTDIIPVSTFLTANNFRNSTCGKRSRTRGHRFSKKRPKYRRYQTEVDDSIIPRKTNAVPKWNNGWSWLGEPFQAKVFLNSDDPLVIRTCYPAMRHMEGDTIRPRDCVLLKAGNKKNELPYVAKVAHLWENPEDGEMMMSLLWYYRPEHTEQGRQPNDCSDEVFASRHRDHNSVACIEDKCYVLTFSEYCRYRKRVRAAEEGIEMENRIVPQLKPICNIPKVPVTTNPEQVMFCQRVYEFRLKRLLKTPTN